MSETRLLHGRWWLADKSFDDAVRGTLTLSDDGFRLDLEGTLHERPTDQDPLTALVDARLPNRVERILGETTDREDLTLENCDLAAHGTHGRRDGGTTYSESYWPRVVCIGGLFEAGEELAFDKVFVRLSSLHPWTAVSGFDPMWQTLTAGEDKPTIQTYSPPPPRSATLSDGTTIRLEFPLQEKTEGLYTFEKRFTQATRFVIDYPRPRAVRDVQQHVYTLRNFLTLAVGEAVKVTDLVGFRKPLPTESPPVGRQVEILYQHLENPRAREIPNHHGMVFLLDDLGDRFEEHMVRWFEHTPELGRVLDLYFSTLHLEFMYQETRFMNFAQAVEGYHRRRLNRTLYDEETFASRKEQILENVSGKTRELAKKALRYANEVSLADRIKDVLDYLGEPATSIVLAGAAGTKLDADGFASRAANVRNVYAHNLEGEEPGSRELALLTHQLKSLVEALFLAELGFEPKVIDAKLKAARRYDLIRVIATG